MDCFQCGAVNPDTNRFCGDCGARLPRSEPASQAAERRQLTVVFCDLVGSTELSTQLDPEDVRHVNRAYREVCAAVVSQYDGLIASYMGDGIMVYFGYPNAHEDDAERAVRAALAAVRGVAELEALPGISLKLRVGIDTGLVVVGDLVGDGTAEARAVSGETANVAARIQGLAEPDTVVITDRTHRLCGGLFEFEDLGKRQLRGVPEPLTCWRAVSVQEVESRFEALHGEETTDLVGRRQEVGTLLDRWRRATHGEGQLVLVSGEAGIGKSRILQTLRERISEEPHRFLRYQCSAYRTTSSLYPVIVQLQHTARFAPDDSPETKLDKLEAVLDQTGGDAHEFVPSLASLLSIPSGDRHPQPGLTPQQQKRRLFAALVGNVLRAAEKAPVAIFFEDAHWIDPTTLELLDAIVDRLGGVRLLLMVTHRPGFAPPWTEGPRVTRVALGSLGRGDSVELVGKVTQGAALPSEVLDRIVEKTDGIPLFIEELTRSVVESDVLRREGNRYVLTGPLSPAIPSTLQDLLEERLDRLSEAKEVAQIGAAIGREFAYGLLASVSDARAEALDAALVQLVSAGLCVMRGTPPQAHFSFRHALIRDVAYGSLLRTQRRRLHSRIAESLEALFPERAESEPEVLAHHLTEAHRFEEAVTHWRRAGKRAAEISANLEAAEHFSRALELLDRTPAEGRARDELELDLQIGLAGSLIATKGYSAPDTERTYARALQLSERIGETPQLFPVLYGRWIFHIMVGEVEKSCELAQEFLRLAGRQKTDAPSLVGQRVLGTSLIVLGNPVAARAHLESVLARYDPERHHSLTFLYGQDVGVAGSCYQALGLWLLGYPEQALRIGGQTLERARSLSHANTLGYAVLHLGGLLQALCGDSAAAGRAADWLREIAVENQLPVYEAAWGSIGGSALVEAGEVERGVALMRESRSRLLDAQLVYMLPILSTFHARGCLAAGRVEEGLQILDEAEELTQRRGDRWFEAEVHRARGELLLAAEPSVPQLAEASLERALEVARAHGARSLELRAATSLARLLHERNRRSEARETLAPVFEWFSEGLDLPDLQHARAVIDELAS